MDVSEHLEEEHSKVEQMIASLEATTRRANASRFSPIWATGSLRIWPPKKSASTPSRTSG